MELVSFLKLGVVVFAIVSSIGAVQAILQSNEKKSAH